MLKVEHVSGGYDGHQVIKDMSFSVKKGEFFGILGPNGSGKTTLLKMISGTIPFETGKIEIDQKDIRQYSKKNLARKMAVLPQLSSHTFPYTVKETVSLGRYAHRKGLFHPWSNEDEQLLRKVMEQTNITSFQDDSIQELSGGEQQRTFLAQALVQEPDILLLDEPTNHLDLAYQKGLLDLLKESATEQGLTVVSIFHELNLASLYCDRLLLLKDGEMKKLHTPDEILTEALIKEVYQTEVKKLSHSEVAKPQMHLLPTNQKTEVRKWLIDASLLDIKEERITLRAPAALRTVSSGVFGAGIGWHRYFVNRKVPRNYHSVDPVKEMGDYLVKSGFHLSQTVGMMTAVNLLDVCFSFWEKEDFSVLTVVTAGIGDATDSTRGFAVENVRKPGTVNTWVFINGKLADEAFIQAIITATEAKTKAFRKLEIKDKVTDTIATGTATDSVLIAATQQGRNFPYAGTATELGQLIGKSVYTETKKAIQKYKKK